MKVLLLCIGLFIGLRVNSQILQWLEQKLQRAKTAKERIYTLDSLANYYDNYYLGGRRFTADSLGYQMVATANRSRNKELMALALLLNGQRLSNSWNLPQATATSVTKADSFLQSTLVYTQTQNLPFYEACAYLHLAELHSRDPFHKDLGKAAGYATKAQDIIASMDNDSLDVLALKYKAMVYQEQKNYVATLRNLATALRKAEKLKNSALQFRLTSDMNYFYLNLGDRQKAVDYALRAVKLSHEEGNGADMVEANAMLVYTYFQLKDYQPLFVAAQRSDALMARMQLPQPTRDYGLGFTYFSYVLAGNYAAAKAFLAAHPEAEAVLQTAGESYFIDVGRAEVFYHEGQQDSAAYYFQQALHSVEIASEPFDIFFVCNKYGEMLLKQGKNQEAIVQFMRAEKASETLQDLEKIRLCVQNLETAYALLGNKSHAYDYLKRYNQINDSLQQLADKKQLALLEVENENKRLQLLQQQEEEKLRRLHHIQYMGITAGVATVFILLVVLGFFSTSTTIIRGLGFFAFIFFFEFIILLADHQIHAWTHGEPWKVLAIKIGLIAMLLPLHHYIEERVVHYLVHHKKISWVLWQKKPVSLEKESTQPVKS